MFPLFNFNRKNAFACGMVFSLVLLAFYVFQTQIVISKEYEIKNQQEATKILSKDGANLRLEALDSTSLATMEEKIGGLDFTKVEEIRYINLSNDYLVKLAK
jgi:cell division protein FtsI/penicillin-binding protein 2